MRADGGLWKGIFRTGEGMWMGPDRRGSVPLFLPAQSGLDGRDLGVELLVPDYEGSVFHFKGRHGRLASSDLSAVRPGLRSDSTGTPGLVTGLLLRAQTFPARVRQVQGPPAPIRRLVHCREHPFVQALASCTTK